MCYLKDNRKAEFTIIKELTNSRTKQQRQTGLLSLKTKGNEAKQSSTVFPIPFQAML